MSASQPVSGTLWGPSMEVLAAAAGVRLAYIQLEAALALGSAASRQVSHVSTAAALALGEGSWEEEVARVSLALSEAGFAPVWRCGSEPGAFGRVYGGGAWESREVPIVGGCLAKGVVDLGPRKLARGRAAQAETTERERQAALLAGLGLALAGPIKITASAITILMGGEGVGFSEGLDFCGLGSALASRLEAMALERLTPLGQGSGRSSAL